MMIRPPTPSARAAVSPRRMVSASGDMFTRCAGCASHLHRGRYSPSLQPERPAGPRVGFRAGFKKLIPVYCLGADEVLFQIGMNGSGGNLSTRSALDRPCAAFILAHGKERDQPEKLIALADQPYQAAFSESIAGEEFGRLFIPHFGEFSFDLATNCRYSRIGTRGEFTQSVFIRRLFQIGTKRRALVHIE